MSDTNQIPDADKLAARKAAAKAGKLWSIEVLYLVGAETKRHVLANQYGHEIDNFREKVFQLGLRLPVDPGHWVIVPPWRIIDINLTRQKVYFEINDRY